VFVLLFSRRASYCVSYTCFENKGTLKLSDLHRPQFIRHRKHRLPPFEGPITYVCKGLFMEYVLLLSDFGKNVTC
jgi:hypothetical protein